MSSSLKALASEIDATVIVCGQLNRQVENRKGARPKSSDLRESGQIEQDADVLVLIGPDTSGEDFDPEEAKSQTILDALFIVDKCRNGATGDVHVTFHKDMSVFLNAEKTE